MAYKRHLDSSKKSSVTRNPLFHVKKVDTSHGPQTVEVRSRQRGTVYRAARFMHHAAMERVDGVVSITPLSGFWKRLPHGASLALSYGVILLLFMGGAGVVLQTHQINGELRAQIDSLRQSSRRVSIQDVHPEVAAAIDESPQTVVLDDEAVEEPRGIEVPSEEEIFQALYDAHQVPNDHLRYLKIPQIGVDALVGNVGLTDGGAVDTPNNVHTTAWFNQGANAEDEVGAMFVVGHYSGITSRGVFWRLDELQVGDTFTVEQGNGKIKEFIVADKANYSVDEVDMQRAITSADPNRLGLNLMTCGGEFDVEDFQYDERTLVRAVEV